MVGVHADCLIHPLTGEPVAMTGVQHYVDNLLTALGQTDPGSDPAATDLHAFTLNVLGPWLERLRAAPDRDRYHWLRDGRLPVTTLEPIPPRFAAGAARYADAARRRAARYGAIYRASRRFDLMHLTDPINGLALPLRPRQLVGTVYDMSVRTHRDTHLPEVVALWEEYLALAVRRFRRIITISEHARQEIAAMLPYPLEQIDVTPLAPRAAVRFVAAEDPGRAAALDRLGLAAETPFVLFIGTLEPRKNLARLIRAFARAVREPGAPAGARLVLAGGVRAAHGDELRAVAQQEGMAGRVVFAGYVSDAEANALMSACAAFAYVSLYEGFGLPPLEAMTCGAPVVSSNVTSLPEVVGDAAVCVDPADSEAMAGALHRLLTDPVENARRRGLSKARAAQFSWRRTAEATLRSYAAALA